jgi:diaminopimelate decarboxylase
MPTACWSSLGARYTWADQPPTVAEYLDVLIRSAREHLPPHAQIIIEPGRSVVATMAATIYRVVTVKRGADDVRCSRRRHGGQP